MIPEIAHLFLIAALLMAGLQCVCAAASAYSLSDPLAQSSRRAAYAVCLLTGLSMLLLVVSFVQNDFSVLYVANHSSTTLPWFYRATAVWGGHEGSMLLWVVMLGLWGAALAYLSEPLELRFAQTMISVMGLLSVLLCAFILITSNPFLRLLPNMPIEGRDLNPLLQDPGFVFHPPILYLGYVGTAVMFAFAIASLITGQMKSAWARWIMPFALVSWCFLTLGICVGSWWAYRELGWGGWWFWDPVENASLMPWLILTALLHALMVTASRDKGKVWTCLLAIFAFSLSLLGTFLVRSGVLTSVHAFAVDPARGVFILGLMLFLTGGALSLFAWRAERLTDTPTHRFVSRENALLLNTVLLMVIMLTVCLGTLYPLIMDALGLGKLSVGPAYFNAVFVPLFLPIVIFIGIGPHLDWQQMDVRVLCRRLRWPLATSVALTACFAFFLSWGWAVSSACFLACWIVSSHVQYAMRKGRLTLKQWGMTLAHIGIAVSMIGMIFSSYLSIDRHVRFTVGTHQSLGPYDIHFVRVFGIEGPNFEGMDAQFAIYRHGAFQSDLDTTKRFYTVSQMAMTHAGIDANVWRDVYIAVGDNIDDNTFAVRLYYKPFVRWIWAGGFLMLMGGACAMISRAERTWRYRQDDTRSVRSSGD